METVIFALKFEKLIVKKIEYAIKYSALLVANQSKKTPFQRHRKKKIIEETIWKIRIWFPEWAHSTHILFACNAKCNCYICLERSLKQAIHGDFGYKISISFLVWWFCCFSCCCCGYSSNWKFSHSIWIVQTPESDVFTCKRFQLSFERIHECKMKGNKL